MAVLGGVIAASVAGIGGCRCMPARCCAAGSLAPRSSRRLAEIEQDDSPLPEAELLVWLPRVVQAMATVTSIAVLNEAIRSAGGMLATVIYAGCVLFGWAVRKAATPAIARLVRRVDCHGGQLAVHRPGVSEARIQEWNEAWTRALEHLEREQQARRSAG